LASSNDFVGRPLSLLGKDRQNQDGISINAIHQPPRLALVIDPQLMASSRNRWHRSRLRHAQLLALLQAPAVSTRAAIENGGVFT